jgi:hypothetical protein
MFQIIVAIVNAVVGLQGSSVDPLKDSARLQGLYIALASGLMAVMGHYMPNVVVDQSQALQIVTAMGYIAGGLWYAFGAIRAAHKTVAGMFASNKDAGTLE